MSQFGTFDNREDRRELLILIDRLGGGLSDEFARQKRAAWLQQLAKMAPNLPETAKVNAAACSVVGAYDLFVTIVGVLGVKIDDAARWLENEVRKQ